MGRGRRFLRWTGLHRSEARAGYLFVSPSVILILLFVVVPMVGGLALSFYRWDTFSPPAPVGLANYLQLPQDSLFLSALRNTMLFAFVSAPLSIVIGLGFAIVINEPWVKGKSFFSTVYFIPVVMSMVAVALIWRWIYDNEFGLLNALLRIVGLPRQMWLQDPRWVVLSLMFVNIWKTVGYNMVIYLAALQDIPAHLIETAALDGANRLQQLRHIALPLLKPTTLFVTIIAFINSFQVFDLVYVFVGERGPDQNSIVMVYDVYMTAFRSYQLGYASAQAAILFLIILAFSIGLFRLMTSEVEY
jgi:multiple sugar transport system permease protein